METTPPFNSLLLTFVIQCNVDEWSFCGKGWKESVYLGGREEEERVNYI